ncbi:NYN domain-containing protein [Candidatus Bathyarchaeota archaeon]|nr:NYN domain-containing protein [Candidatus Bathyarchaeota archaeon]
MDAHERVMVFIDGSNVFHALRRLGLKIDYQKLVNVLVGERTLVRPYYYASMKVPQIETQYRFHRALGYEGFTVITKPVKAVREDVWIEKGVDLALATDMLVSAFRNLFDTAILVSGDQDFVTVLDEVKRLGKKVEVAAFQSTIGNELKVVADRYVALDDLYDQIRL